MAVGHIIAMVGERNEILTVDAFVEEVYNSKLPDLMEVLAKARAKDLVRYDAHAVKWEGEIIAPADLVKALCLRIAVEQNFERYEEDFDELWERLHAEFGGFSDYCVSLGIRLSDAECLILSLDDEGSLNEGVESSDSEEEEGGNE